MSLNIKDDLALYQSGRWVGSSPHKLINSTSDWFVTRPDLAGALNGLETRRELNKMTVQLRVCLALCNWHDKSWTRNVFMKACWGRGEGWGVWPLHGRAHANCQSVSLHCWLARADYTSIITNKVGLQAKLFLQSHPSPSGLIMSLHAVSCRGPSGLVLGEVSVALSLVSLESER